MPVSRRRVVEEDVAVPPEEVAPVRKKKAAAQPETAEGLDREGLLTALTRMRPALRTGGAIPELGHLWFSGGHVSAYDGGLGIRLVLEVGVECGAPGRPLLGLLGTSSLKQVALKMDGSAMMVVMGRSRTKLNVLDPGRNPWPFPVGGTHEGAPARLSEVAIEALRSILIVKASPAARLEHHGIFVYVEGDDVDFYATDSRTIVQATISEKKSGLPAFTFLPRPLAEQIVALCPHGVELYVASDHMAAVGSGVEVCSNVLDTEGIVNLPSLTSKHYRSHPDPIAIPAGLEAALDRAEVLAGSDEALVAIEIVGKKFRLSGKYAFGELKEELALEATHPDVEFKIGATAVRKGLLAADSFSATADSLAFVGGDTFLYLTSAHT